MRLLERSGFIRQGFYSVIEKFPRPMMDEYEEKYGSRFVILVDGRASKKVFEFDQSLLMPTASSYRALVELAKMEINPRIMRYLSQRWSEGTIEGLSFFAMAAAVYARSILDPPVNIDVGRILLRTAAACNRRCIQIRNSGGGCRAARNSMRHHLPKCIKLPLEISVIWGYLKRYIATGGATCPSDAAGVSEAMKVDIQLRPDFSPEGSC